MSESPAGIPENNSVTAANCDNSRASPQHHFGQLTVGENPAGTLGNNNVTAVNCDNPRVSTPTSSLDNSKNSALSQLITHQRLLHLQLQRG